MTRQTVSQLVAQLKERCSATTQRAVAQELGISESYLSDILLGRRAPGPSLLRALGYTRRIVLTRGE